MNLYLMSYIIIIIIFSMKILENLTLYDMIKLIVKRKYNITKGEYMAKNKEKTMEYKTNVMPRPQAAVINLVPGVCLQYRL